MLWHSLSQGVLVTVSTCYTLILVHLLLLNVWVWWWIELSGIFKGMHRVCWPFASAEAECLSVCNWMCNLYEWNYRIRMCIALSEYKKLCRWSDMEFWLHVQDLFFNKLLLIVQPPLTSVGIDFMRVMVRKRAGEIWGRLTCLTSESLKRGRRRRAHKLP